MVQRTNFSPHLIVFSKKRADQISPHTRSLNFFSSNHHQCKCKPWKIWTRKQVPDISIFPNMRISLFGHSDRFSLEELKSDISAETLWVGGWLLRQLLSYNVEDSSRHHPELLKELHKNYINCLLGEVTEIRCDVLIAAVIDAWKKCKTVDAAPCKIAFESGKGVLG